jgi:hypothetical protein
MTRNWLLAAVMLPFDCHPGNQSRALASVEILDPVVVKRMANPFPIY